MFTVTDNADGTADVTVSGTAGGASNVAWTMQVSSQWPPSFWANSGSRLGDSTITIAPGEGVYWIALTTDGAWEPPQYAPITNGDVPVIDQILDAVVARIRLLSLTDFDPANIFPATLLEANKTRDARLNTIVVAPTGEGEPELAEGSVSSDVVSYPVLIAIAAPANRDQSQANRRKWLYWRERIRKAFLKQGLTLPTGCVKSADLITLPAIVREWWERNAFASLLAFSFRSKESRGM